MANYGIIRMKKFQMSDVQGIQKHNQRQGKSKTNPDIIESKTHLNFDLINEGKIKYEQTIKNKINERVKRKPRANSVVLSEFLVTATPEYIQNLSPQEQKKYFSSSLEFIQKKYGAENVLYATIHQDEANPHMHVGIVPITKDNRLAAKDLFNGKQVMIQLQDDFHEHIVKNGFDLQRGESKAETNHEHISIHELKKSTEQELERLQEDVKGLVDAVKVSESVESISVEKGGLFDRRSVRMASEDFDRIKTLAKASEGLRMDVKGLKKEIKDLEEQNIILKNQNKQVVKEKQQLVNKVITLQKENTELKVENKTYKSFNAYYEKVFEEMKRLSEQYLKIDLAKVQRFFGQVRMLTAGKVFGQYAIDEKMVDSLIPKDEQDGAREYIDFHKKKNMAQKIAEQPVQPEKTIENKNNDYEREM